MKTMKKLFSIVLVLALVLSLGISAWATTTNVETQEATATVKINQKNSEKPHSYKAYQIFSGTQNALAKEDNQPLADIKWGSGINADDFIEALANASNTDENVLQSSFPYEKDTATSTWMKPDPTDPSGKKKIPVTATEVAKDIAAITYEVNLNEVANLALANKVDTAGISLTDGDAADVELGYYVIEDVTEGLKDANDAQNKTMLQVTEDINVTIKYDVPTSEKKVVDTNDSVDFPIVSVTPGDTNVRQDSADYDFGDEIYFELSATTPTNLYKDYEEYELIFHDVEDAGLSFNKDSVKVYVDETLIEASADTYTLVTEGLEEDGCTFEVRFCDLLKMPAFNNNEAHTVQVIYTSTLTEDAKIGPTGNKNELQVEFTNSSTNNQHGKTPKDHVIVFTYDLDVNKVTKGEGDENVPLEGAEFALYKKVTDDYVVRQNEELEINESIIYVDPNTGKTSVTSQNGYVRCVEVKLTQNSGGTIFTGNGVDDGNYILVETKTPPGYNSIDPIEFTVYAEHEEESEDPNLTKLQVKKGEEILSESKGDEIPPFQVKMDTGEINTDVVNNEGLQLPETGGIGTTILYVVGGVLVVVAVIFLITKKRMGKAQR